MAFSPRMVQGGLASSLLGRLALRPCLWCRHHARPQRQIFVLDAFIPIAHLHRSILPLTDQGLALRRSVPPVLRLELQKMPAVLHHPIVADPAFRLESKNLSQPRRTGRPQVVILASRRFPRKSSVVLRKIIRFQIFIRSFVALDPLATQFLYQAILMYPVVALHPSFRLRRTGCDNANLQSFAHAPKLRRGRLSSQALSLCRRALIDILPIRVQRPGYPILLDPRSQHPRRCPDRFLLPQTRTRGPRGVIHHIHQTSAGSPLLKPRMEAPIHLHQVAKVLPPFPAFPMRFPSSHAAPQTLR